MNFFKTSNLPVFQTMWEFMSGVERPNVMVLVKPFIKRRGIVSSFPCHGHVYFFVLSKATGLTLTMTKKTRYKVVLKDLLLSSL